MTEIEITEVEEHEDGSATYEFDLDEETAVSMAQLGLTFVFYCRALGKSTDQVFSEMLQQIDNRQVEIEETIAGRFDEYGFYGENNPPLMSNPGDKDYEV